MGWDEKFNKGYHVEELRYYYSKEHQLLGSECEKGISTQNIGKAGENLTIAVLSMNRASLTIRLLNSIKEYIPGFSGEFLIGDNGSDESEKRKLYDAMNLTSFRCRMIEFGQNYGVSGGRNRLFKEVKTDWFLSADNDLYFVGNPLKKIQTDLSILGCHFLAIPIVDKENNGTGIYGGHLYVENLLNQVGIGGSSLFFSDSVPLNIDNPPFLCTFLPGGAAVINKSTFFSVGGFDDNMFVGFEDVEFSLRLFQKGMKIGGCGMVSVIHDHPKPEIHADVNYEKKRFSTDRLRLSGQYFEKKHGFSVWNFASEEWVNKRLDELVIDEKIEGLTHDYRRKKTIALLIDRPGWAFDNIASEIERYLSDEFIIKKIYQSQIDCLAGVFLLAEDCDMIHFLWRPLVTAMNDEYTQRFIENLRMTQAEFTEKYVKNKVISVAVYDHFFLTGVDSDLTERLFTRKESLVDSYTVSSKKLYTIYCENPMVKKKPALVTSDGVDCTLFSPMNLERFDNVSTRTIRIGWVGNSKFQIKDLKGVHTIIKPAIENLQQKGYNVELITSDRDEKLIPHNEMPSFYKSIDIYICASLHEGTPNPVLEAMACGIPVISTDVGIVTDAFGPKQRRYILAERTVECLEEAIINLLNHPSEFKVLSQENLKYVKKWDWSVKVENFRYYFRKIINEKEEHEK